MATEVKVEPSVITGAPPVICIIGQGGIGKTRLTSLFPDAYCLDVEGGAGSAYSPDRMERIDLNQGTGSINQLLAKIRQLNSNPYEGKRLILPDGRKIGAIVIDAIDSLQMVVKYDYLSRKKLQPWQIQKGIMTPSMEQQDWGQLLDIMMPLILETKKIKVPTIIVAHSDTDTPTFRSDGQLLKVGSSTFSAQGALRTHMQNWMDYIIHLIPRTVIDDKGTPTVMRMAYTQPLQLDNIVYLAKDRHNVFASLGRVEFTVGEDPDRPGFPKTKAMTLIHDSHSY